jgi:hypothetical protein
MNWNSSVGIATGYGLDDRGLILSGGGEFSLRHRVHTGSRTHPAPCPMGTGGTLTQGVRRTGFENDRSPPSSAEFKESVELYLHSLNTSLWRGA